MSKFRGKTALAGMLVAGLALIAAPQFVQAQDKATDGMVAATVNGEKIYKKDIEEIIKGLPLQAEVPVENVYPAILDQVINDRLLAATPQLDELRKDPEVLQRQEQMKEQVLRSIFVERLVEKNVTPAAVKAEYEKIKKENKDKQEVRARHILVKTEDEAKAIIKEIEGGAKFEDVAKAKSEDKGSGARGGDLGYFAKEDMVPEFAAAAFDIKTGKVGQKPVRTQFGWHVIKVEDKRARQIPPFDQVEQVIKNKLSQEAVQKFVQDLRAKAEIKRFTLDGKPMN